MAGSVGRRRESPQCPHQARCRRRATVGIYVDESKHWSRAADMSVQRSEAPRLDSNNGTLYLEISQLAVGAPECQIIRSTNAGYGHL